jgi:hypothetical protein
VQDASAKGHVTMDSSCEKGRGGAVAYLGKKCATLEEVYLL